MSEEALQIGVERREGKGKGERERYIQLNAEFQRIARRDKKALDEQCKEIEENSRMGNFSFHCILLFAPYNTDIYDVLKKVF